MTVSIRGALCWCWYAAAGAYLRLVSIGRTSPRTAFHRNGQSAAAGRVCTRSDGRLLPQHPVHCGHKKTRTEAGLISCRRNILRLKAYTTSSDKSKFKYAKKLNIAHIFIQSCHSLKLLVCTFLFYVAFIHQRFIERFPVTRPCSDMEIRNAPQDCFVGHCRRH